MKSNKHQENTIIEPSLCSECGGRSFRLLQEESKNVNTQLLVTGSKDTSRKLQVVIEDDLTSWDDYNIGLIRFTGTLKTFREERSGKFKFIRHLLSFLNHNLSLRHQSHQTLT